MSVVRDVKTVIMGSVTGQRLSRISLLATVAEVPHKYRHPKQLRRPFLSSRKPTSACLALGLCVCVIDKAVTKINPEMPLAVTAVTDIQLCMQS